MDLVAHIKQQSTSWEGVFQSPIPRRKRGDPIPDEYVEMALAWVRGDISMGQMQQAFKGDVYYRLAAGLKKAIDDGRLIEPRTSE